MFEFIFKFFEYFITQNIPEIKSIDLFFDQFTLEQEGQDDSRPNPRILIEFPPFEITQELSNIQTSNLNVIFHIGIDIYGDFWSKGERQNSSFKYLNLLDTIYEKLNHLSSFNLPEELQSNKYKIYNITRNSISLSIDNTNLKENLISFNFNFEDYSLYPSEETTIIESIETEYDISNTF